jgi:hypothetical protein
MTILLLPALISIFIMGWSLYSMGYQGHQKRGYKIQNRFPKKDYVTIMPIIYEKPQEIGSMTRIKRGNGYEFDNQHINC